MVMGKNDKFEIKGLLDGGYPDSELAIYNRWGKKFILKSIIKMILVAKT